MFVKFHTVLKVLCRDITVAPLEKHHRIYEECQYKVEEHTPTIMSRLPGGLVRNSMGLGSCLIEATSIDSSIMPAILQ